MTGGLGGRAPSPQPYATRWPLAFALSLPYHVPMHAFLTEATARGFIHQCTDTDALSAALTTGPISAYVGYDCTADSLHVGNLVSIMMLRLWQKHGQRPVVLMGGGTTRIGDPSRQGRNPPDAH